MVPFSSRSQVVNFFKWKHHYFHSNELKKVSFDDFFMTTWERENKSERKKNHKLPLYTHSCRFLFFLSKKVRLMIYTWFWGWVVMPGYTKLIWRTRSANILLFKIFRYTWQCSKTFFFIPFEIESSLFRHFLKFLQTSTIFSDERKTKTDWKQFEAKDLLMRLFPWKPKVVPNCVIKSSR